MMDLRQNFRKIIYLFYGVNPLCTNGFFLLV